MCDGHAVTAAAEQQVRLVTITAAACLIVTTERHVTVTAERCVTAAGATRVTVTTERRACHCVTVTAEPRVTVTEMCIVIFTAAARVTVTVEGRVAVMEDGHGGAERDWHAVTAAARVMVTLRRV